MNPATEQKQVVYFSALDGLRAFAFFIVFISHSGGLNRHGIIAKYLGRGFILFFDWLVTVGWSGVDLFFVLSAFLITYLLLKEEDKYGKVHYRAFLIRRILRIWPLYFLAVLSGLLIFPFITLPVVTQFNTPAYWEFVRNNGFFLALFLVNYGIAMGFVNPPANLQPLWSISMEEQFYLLWGLAMETIRSNKKRLLILAGLLIMSFISRLIIIDHHTPPIPHSWFYASNARVDAIVLGSGLGFLWFYGQKQLQQYLTRFAFLLPILATVILVWQCLTNPDGPRAANVFVYFFISLGWAVGLLGLLLSSFWSKIFSFKPLIHLGRLSFGMYVWHAFVLEALRRFLIPQLPSFQPTDLLLLVGYPLSYFIALATWFGYERYFLKLKQRFAFIPSGQAQTL